MVENNFLGKKTGKGFYLYDENGKSTGINPAVAEKLNSNKKNGCNRYPNENDSPYDK